MSVLREVNTLCWFTWFDAGSPGLDWGMLGTWEDVGKGLRFQEVRKDRDLCMWAGYFTLACVAFSEGWWFKTENDTICAWQTAGEFCCGSGPQECAFNHGLGFRFPILSVCFSDSEGSTPMFLSADRNRKPRENPNCCALAQQTIQVSLGEELQLYCSAGKGQHALPRMLLVPEMWNSAVRISSVCAEVWHRSFQNMNLFYLTKCTEGVGVGVVKVTADEVKARVTAALDQPGSCQSSPTSACGKETAGFPMCTQRKNLELRN